MGRALKTQLLNDNQGTATCDTSDLASGTYIVALKQDDKTLLQKKLIKE